MSDQGLKELQKASTAPAKKIRGPLYTFKFPPSVRLGPHDPETVSLVALDVEQELHGNQLMGEKGNVYKKIALSVARIDGRDVDWGSGEIDAKIAAMSPKCREQLNLAFVRIHRSTNEEDQAFLDSMTTDVV